MFLNIWFNTLAMLGRIMYCTGVPHVAMHNMKRITRVNSSNASKAIHSQNEVKVSLC